MLPTGADVEIGGVGFKLDQAYERITGRRCYVHGGRYILPNRTEIVGNPGGQNFKEGYLVWTLTRFDGEGQVVLDVSDNASPFRFYRSEGLDFKTSGQAKLNKSTLSQQVKTTTSTSTRQGNADFEDVTGTSTTSGTDRKLVANADEIRFAAVTTPGAVSVQVDAAVYIQSWASGASTIEGSAMALYTGDGAADTGGGASEFILRPSGGAQTGKLDSGDELTAGTLTRAEYYLWITAPSSGFYADEVVCSVIDVTDSTHEKVVASKRFRVTATSAPSTPNATLQFNPVTGKTYRLRVKYPDAPGNARIKVDKVMYGPDVTAAQIQVKIRNMTDAVDVTSRLVTVSSTATAGSSPGTIVTSIGFTGTAAKDYRVYIKRISSTAAVWVDKVDVKTQTGAAWEIDCLDFGQDQKVWLGAHSATATTNSVLFTYDSTNDEWDSTVTLNDGATTYDAAILAMAHTDSLEYALLDNNEVYTGTSGGTDDRFAYFSANAKTCVGMTIAQNRLWVLTEDGTYAGSTVYSVPVDDTSVNPWNLNLSALSTGVRYTTINTGTKTADKTIKQRMCSSPTGARFFVNSANVTAKVYEVDGSGTTLAPRELADLGTGVKATCIAYEAGITFVGALYYGSSGTADTATDVDKLARPVLFAIDQNGVVQRIGFMRRDDPAAGAPQFIVPYQTDLYILQSGLDAAGSRRGYVWRYALTTGGLFLEYELSPATPSDQQALALLFGRTFAAYTSEVFTTGSVGTYRQASVTGGNTFTSSIWDFALPAVRKTLARIDVTTDTLASNTAVRVEYQTDQDGTWTLAGLHTSGSSQTFYIADEAFTSLQLRATLISTDGVDTPVLYGMTVWASSAEDEEYFDLVLLTEDEDSGFRIAGEQVPGSEKSAHVVNLWRRKVVTTLKDGYASKMNGSEDYNVTVEDLRVEQNALGEGRTVVTLRVVR